MLAITTHSSRKEGEIHSSAPEAIKLYSCLTQLSMKFKLFINSEIFGFGFVEALRPSKQFFSHVGMDTPLLGYYQYFSGIKFVFAHGHNMAEVGIEPPISRSRYRGSTTRPPQKPAICPANKC